MLLSAALLLSSCSEGATTAPCGGIDTFEDNPPAARVSSAPFILTNRTTGLPISGTRPPNSKVIINDTQEVAASCDGLWSALVDVPVEGTNQFTLVVESRSLNRSGETILTVIRDTAAPAAPTITPPPASVATGTVVISGSRESGATVLLDGIPVVPAGAATGFTIDVPLPLAGGATNILTFQQRDGAGNLSAATVVQVIRTGIAVAAPRLNAPLNRQQLAGSAAGLPPITLVWNVVNDPNGVGYRVQVSADGSFTGAALLVNRVFAGLNTTLQLDYAPPGNGTFFWRVATTDAAGVDHFGLTRSFRVRTVPGDVNGDGLSDILAGVPGSDGGRPSVSVDNRGRADLIFGSTTLGANNTPATSNLSYHGQIPLGEAGISVTMGDLNGDGYADVIMGAHRVNTHFRLTGAVYVYFGSSTPDNVADLTLTGQNFSDGFGSVVSSGFDLNDDGFDDFAVGSRQFDEPGTDNTNNRGRVYVYFGGPDVGGNPTVDDVPDLILDGNAAQETFGGTIAGGFDFNADGIDDLAVGGPLADRPASVGGSVRTGAGRVAVYYGGAAVDALPDVELFGDVTDEHFGLGISGAGDMDGDGFDELAVGSPAFGAGGTPSIGRVHLFKGGPVPQTDTAQAVVFQGVTGNEAFGLRIAGGGDMNGDGLSDMAVGVAFGDSGSAPEFGDRGVIEIHLGSPTLDTIPDARFDGEAGNDRLGLGIHMSGDINGDTLHDLVFGAPNNDQSSNIFGDTGRAYVLYGPGGAASTVWSPLLQSVAVVSDTVPGVVINNLGDKDGMGTSVW